MNFIEKTRLFFHQYFLKKQLSQKSREQSRKQISFENAKTVGLLFDATELDTRHTVLEFAKSLKEKGKKVRLLGFFDNTLIDDNFTFKYYNRKNIDWALRPGGEAVHQFIAQTFDLLIDLETEGNQRSEYIAALSSAHLKVGPCTENTYCYDLMVDTSDKDNLSNFISEIERLLEKTTTSYEPAPV